MRDLHQIMKDIQPYIDFIFKYEDEFLRSFSETFTPEAITTISFGADEISYTLEDGESGTITTKGFVSWMRKTRGEYP